MKPHYSFPKIQQYHQVLKHLKLQAQYTGKDEQGDPVFDHTLPLPTIKFEGRTKLHGTNAAIVFSADGSFYCQSRERIIDELTDNAGFAHWAHKEGHRIFAKLPAFDDATEHLVLYGEWCGGSIQASVALNQLPKMFVVFGLKAVPKERRDDEHYTWLPITGIQDPSIQVYNIEQIPAYEIEVDLERPDKAIEQMTAWVEEIDQVCPFAKFLGVEGHGEGLVFRPATDLGYNCAFKVKGPSHAQSKIRKLPTVDVQRMDTIQQAVDTHCHEDRLEQGYKAVVRGPEDETPQKIADFIRWVVNDLWTEEQDALRASDISQKEIGAATSKKAARWFQTKLAKF